MDLIEKLKMKRMETFILTKDDPITVYFKCKDQTGRTNTSTKDDAMKFNSKDDAIDYNHEWLYGDYTAVRLTS